MSLFSYKEFLEELKNHELEEKRNLYTKWIGISNVNSIEEEPFYDYLCKFELITYNVPLEFKVFYDWDLLLRLVVSSFSSTYKIVMPCEDLIWKNSPELEINISSKGEIVTAHISELWSYQILKLFEIYVEELINLQILYTEDKREAECIARVRNEKLKAYNIKRIKILNSLRRNKLMR
jgi:hypothetical protein